MSETQALQVLTGRTAVLVTSEEQEAAESANLIVITKARKAAEGKFDELRKPFKDGLDKLKLEFDAVVNPLKQAEALSKGAILAWKAAERLRIDKEKAERDRQQRELERQAAQKNQPPPKPLAEVQDQAKGWKTDRGTASTRKIKKWRVADETQIPYEIVHNGETLKLWEIVSASVTKIRQATPGTVSPIPGVEFFEEEGLAIR